MKRIKLVLIDEDIYYLDNLVNYIATEYNDLIKVSSFSDINLLEEFIEREEETDIILASEKFFEELSKKNSSIKLVLLSNENNDTNNIYKYQSADKSCKEVIEIFGASENIEVKAGGTSSIITFYSPIGGIGTTTLAIASAIRIANNGNKVLYLNFEKIQSNGIFLPKIKSRYNFSDLIINVKEGSWEFDEVLKEVLIKYEDIEMYYINPIDSILDLEDMSAEDMKDLANNLIKTGLFDYIIIDLPSELNSKYYDMFNKSINTVMTMGQDLISSYKVDTMLKQLDDISKFKFIINMYSESKEKRIPKCVAENVLPIISTIEYDNDLRGTADIFKVLSNHNMFENEITRIVSKII